MPDQKDETNINNVLDTIIAEKGGGHSVTMSSSQNFFERYVAALKARDPVFMGLTALTGVTLVIMTVAALSSSGGNRSAEQPLTDDTNSQSTVTVNATPSGSVRVESGDTTGDVTSDETTITDETSTTSQPTTVTTTTTVKNPAAVKVQPSRNVSDNSSEPDNSTTPGTTPVTKTPVKTNPAPSIKLGKLCNIKDGSLNESSGLAASVKHTGIVYTHNDETGPIYAVDIATCKVKAKISVNGFRSGKLGDPEAIAIDHTTGKIWLGDIGNGHPGQTKAMTSKTLGLKDPKAAARIIVFDEPTNLSGKPKVSNAKTYDIQYSGGMQNSEALLVNPKTGQGYLINKLSTSVVYKLPHPLKSGTAQKTNVTIPGYVTDATFTNDGKYILVRWRTAKDPAPTSVYVYDANWKKVGSIRVPKVTQGESITVEKSGKTFLIGSEGSNPPLVRVALPEKFGGYSTAAVDLCPNLPGNQTSMPSGYTKNSNGTCSRKTSAGSSSTSSAGKIDLKPWKLTLPIKGSGGEAKEIVGTDLTKYSNGKWYSTVKDKAGKVTSVKFFADSSGATTANSGNPRSELREMKASNPKQEYNWSPYSGTHQMLIRQKVTALTGDKMVVIGQIHDVGDAIDDYAVFRLEGTKLYAFIDGKKSSSKLLDSNVKLGKVITVGFAVKNGTISFLYDANGGSNPKAKASVKYPSGSKGAYFKAGSYCQCGKEKHPKGGSAGVQILGLDVTHDGKLPDIGALSSKPFFLKKKITPIGGLFSWSFGSLV